MPLQLFVTQCANMAALSISSPTRPVLRNNCRE